MATIVVSANQAWNLVNFRTAVLSALVADGHRIVALAPPDPVAQAALARLGVEFHALTIDAKGVSPHRDAALTARYYRAFRTLKPAAYLAWTIKPNIYGGIAAGLAGVPFIPNISGLGTAFIRESLLTRIVRGLYRVGLRSADTVFFQNEDDRRMFDDMGLVRPSKAVRIPGSGISVERFVPPENETRAAPKLFLLVARLLGDKGVREFVDAARSIRSRRQDMNFGLLGAADAENRTAISSAELSAWVAEGVVEHWPPVDDVRPMMLRADAVVLPSYREGVSRVLLEASALARPLVTTDVPGCRDVVEDGKTGFLAQARDASSLAQAMERVADLPDADWRAMGAAGRRKVADEFSEAAVVAAYRNALRKAWARAT